MNTELLTTAHLTSQFKCGEHTLDYYLKKHALKNSEEGHSKAYAWAERDLNVKAYHTISASSIIPDDLPAFNLAGQSIPSILLGRFAVDRDYHGKGVGGFLLIDALKKARDAAEIVGIRFVYLDAINEKARIFYTKHGFTPFPGDERKLYMKMTTIRAMLDSIDIT